MPVHLSQNEQLSSSGAPLLVESIGGTHYRRWSKCPYLGKPHYLWVGGWKITEIAITLANRLIFAYLLEHIY